MVRAVPAPIGPLLGLALGALFAWLESDGTPRGKANLTLPGLALVALFGLLVYGPAAAYFIAYEPDWAYAYILDSGQRLGALHALVLLADAASVPLGFALCQRAAHGPSATVFTRVAGGPLLAAGVFVVVLFPRLSVQATFAQFHGDFGTRPVAGGPLGYALIWTAVVLAGATVWTTYALRRMR